MRVVVEVRAIGHLLVLLEALLNPTAFMTARTFNVEEEPSSGGLSYSIGPVLVLWGHWL